MNCFLEKIRNKRNKEGKRSMHMYHCFLPSGRNLLCDVLGVSRSYSHGTSPQIPDFHLDH